ncbi:PH domain-containing protein [Arthrobacter caoxuetaonis]|uniref:PH domain-containing protein n=1 Tax=Arthrobacter caoxuetaonis TaxID=2886935 RepID=A0A9X1MI92_9MICC|nr:PH domain-containing protein [Arthrobacter caoxuetaonis]MCC3299822.1 PH domain-containing protein [Arthrobacter caoxuetaonis]USQ59278.1 PH domain-containing protein [Arthrobacter caoxuetaonis]
MSTFDTEAPAATSPNPVKLPRDLRLNPGEEAIYLLRTHPKVLFLPAVTWLILVGAAVACYMFVPRDMLEGWLYLGLQAVTCALTIHYAAWPILQWWKKVYIVTTKQLIIREGVLYKKSISSQLIRVSDIQVERGILDRIFRCGTLVIINAANGEAAQAANRVIFTDVPHALKVEQTLKDMVYHNSAVAQMPGASTY